MNPIVRFLTRAVLLVAVSILFIVGCSRGARLPSVEEVLASLRGISFDRQEALILRYPCDDPDQLPSEVAALLAEANAVQNEVHDCQKLVVAGQSGPEFGPLVGIFPIQSEEPVLTGDGGIVVATIFNWGTEDYSLLDIREHWSCLVLKPSAVADWSAEIRPAAARCAAMQFAEHDNPDTLPVVRTEHGDVPMTARWGWDDDDDVHYIGFPCPVGPSAWCEVGPPDFQPRQWLEVAGQLTVPGWYDEQHLAVPGTGSSNLSPGPWGTIFPSPILRDSTMWHRFEQPGGAPAAYVLLEDTTNSASYFARFGFRATPGVTVPRNGNRINLVADAEHDWVAHIYTSGASEPVKGFAMTVAEVSHGERGSVRWRWSDEDESSWIPCPDGCCSPEESEAIAF